MGSKGAITVFGAYGHTGRFVVSELLRRGWQVILSGRDEAKLRGAASRHPGSEVRPASVEDAASLDRAISGAVAVINCAGPFLDTAAAVTEAALRARIHYLDVTAEQRAALAAFEHFSAAARDAGVVVAPAMAFYGGLSDLLATVAMGEWTAADEVCVAVGLDSWRPTQGTLLTGKHNAGPRFTLANNKLEILSNPPPTRTWTFPAPFGTKDVVALHLTETILISRHLRTPEIRAYINLAPLEDLHNPDTPPPTPADESGRSAQVFVVDVMARRGSEERRATARGRDIYAITAPLVVEAAERVVEGRFRAPGVAAPGELFDARDFLKALSPTPLAVEIQ
jgi:NAD(P)-dependent dehydrogenase (short-subunit alcohol dehydrogenase family)